MRITKTDMAKILALLPFEVASQWDSSAIYGVFFVHTVAAAPHTFRAAVVGSDGVKRSVAPGRFTSVYQIPRNCRIDLASGRGWHAQAAKHLSEMLTLEHPE